GPLAPFEGHRRALRDAVARLDDAVLDGERFEKQRIALAEVRRTGGAARVLVEKIIGILDVHANRQFALVSGANRRGTPRRCDAGIAAGIVEEDPVDAETLPGVDAVDDLGIGELLKPPERDVAVVGR